MLQLHTLEVSFLITPTHFTPRNIFYRLLGQFVMTPIAATNLQVTSFKNNWALDSASQATQGIKCMPSRSFSRSMSLIQKWQI